MVQKYSLMKVSCDFYFYMYPHPQAYFLKTQISAPYKHFLNCIYFLKGQLKNICNNSGKYC